MITKILYSITGAILKNQPKPAWLQAKETAMTTEKIKALQTHVKTEPDGFWGPASIAACQAHLKALMPSPSPWPKTDEASLLAFYGRAGDKSKLVNLKVDDLGILYEGKPVKTIRCHGKVADSLRRILEELARTQPEILRKFDGCFNDRNMRGGTRKSLHARGAATDWDAAANGNLTAWPVKATMPIEVMEAFVREGWIAAGAFWGRDAMHFQATR